jgi:hypothetical protein
MGVPLYPWPPRNARQSDQAGVADSALSPRAESRIRTHRCSVSYVGTAPPGVSPSQGGCRPSPAMVSRGWAAALDRTRRADQDAADIHDPVSKFFVRNLAAAATTVRALAVLRSAHFSTVRRGALKSVDRRRHAPLSSPATGAGADGIELPCEPLQERCWVYSRCVFVHPPGDGAVGCAGVGANPSVCVRHRRMRLAWRADRRVGMRGTRGGQRTVRRCGVHFGRFLG